jgi:hypothetical protein
LLWLIYAESAKKQIIGLFYPEKFCLKPFQSMFFSFPLQYVAAGYAQAFDGSPWTLLGSRRACLAATPTAQYGLYTLYHVLGWHTAFAEPRYWRGKATPPVTPPVMSYHAGGVGRHLHITQPCFILLTIN